MSHRHVAERDDSLHARIVSRLPLLYADGADPSLDRPAHVRAGSGLARVPGGVALVQDDALFVAVFELATARVRAIALPADLDGRRQFDTGRGNKAQKMDLEACVALDFPEAGAAGETVLVAFGSGSTARRERLAVVTGWDGAADARVVHLPRLYAALRAERRFAGSEMNVEGAVRIGDRVRLFARGNGAARGDDTPVNATCDLALDALLAHLRDPERHDPPTPTAVAQYDLGAIDGVPLGFTDATPWGDGVLYTAAAEDSPNAYDDGRVAGSALGVIDGDGRARWTTLREADGAPFVGKVEGIAPGDEGRLLVVIDCDAPDTPSELCTVEIAGL